MILLLVPLPIFNNQYVVHYRVIFKHTHCHFLTNMFLLQLESNQHRKWQCLLRQIWSWKNGLRTLQLWVRSFNTSPLCILYSLHQYILYQSDWYPLVVVEPKLLDSDMLLFRCVCTQFLLYTRPNRPVRGDIASPWGSGGTVSPWLGGLREAPLRNMDQGRGP